jgi:hypothetical protein
MAAIPVLAPGLPMGLQQVGRYLGSTGRGANPFGKAFSVPNRTLGGIGAYIGCLRASGLVLLAARYSGPARCGHERTEAGGPEDRTVAWRQTSAIATLTAITIRRRRTATAVGTAGAAVVPAAAFWLAAVGSVLPKAVTFWATRFARKPRRAGAPCLPVSP